MFDLNYIKKRSDFMKPKLEDIKYIDKIDELVDKDSFINYINYLIDNKIRKYICYVDVDNMKDINDKYGNDVGDTVLKTIGDHLVSSKIIDCATYDKSDEFLFSCEEDYDKVFDELIGNVRSNYIKDFDLNYTLSIVVISIFDAKDFNELYDILTKHMPRAKAKGKNCALFCRIEKEVCGNMVVPHIRCKFCHKFTNIDEISKHVLEPYDFLKNRWYRNIKIHRCNHCNVAAINLKEPFEFNHDILTSDDYLSILNKDLSDDKKNILLATLIYVSINDYLKAGMLMYLYYEITRKKNAINYVKEYLNKDDSFESRILLTDILRKTNQIDKYSLHDDRLKDYKPKNRLERMLISHENYKLCKNNTDDLSYEEDPIGKHIFKNDINDHDNLTNIEEYDGDNIEYIHAIFDVPPEYKLISVVDYKEIIYGIFVIPYLNKAKVYEFDGESAYAKLIPMDSIFANELIDKFKNLNIKNEKYFNNKNIKKSNKKYNGFNYSYFIDKLDYDDIFLFYNEHKKEKVKSNYYIRNSSSEKMEMGNPTFISKLHIKKDVKEIYLYNYVVDKILFDGTLNDWIKIKKEGFDYKYKYRFGDNLIYELCLKDENGDIEFEGNYYKRIKDIIIDSSEIITKYSFYGMNLKTVRLSNVKIVKEMAFERTKINEFYIDNNINEFISNLNVAKYNKYLDGYYVGDEVTKYVLLLKYNATNKDYIVHNECRAILGNLRGKEKIKNVYLANSKVASIPDEYFLDCHKLETVSLPKSIIKIGSFAFTNANIKELYYDGSIDDFIKIAVDDIGYDPITERPGSAEASPIKEDTDIFLLDDNGKYELNGKKYSINDDIECNALIRILELADSFYNRAKNPNELITKRDCYFYALDLYRKALKYGADYVVDRIEEIKEFLAKTK